MAEKPHQRRFLTKDQIQDRQDLVQMTVNPPSHQEVVNHFQVRRKAATAQLQRQININ